jgi:hypothetical protein
MGNINNRVQASPRNEQEPISRTTKWQNACLAKHRCKCKGLGSIPNTAKKKKIRNKKKQINMRNMLL